MKRIMIILGIFAYLPSLYAQSVSKERATQMAVLYACTSKCESTPISARSFDKQAAIDTSNTYVLSVTNKAPLYVVQMEDGWVLVSSELAVTPILASAPTGQFPVIEDMPDGMKWLFSYYENALQYARDSLPNNVINQDWLSDSEYHSRYRTAKILSRMGQIHWNQGANNSGGCLNSYNKFCPTWYTPECGHTYVGCTAVAMGQVMQYWQWPHSAIVPSNMLDSLGNTSGKSLREYDWDKMPDNIYYSTPDDEADEIAGFLRDCGYASKMKYKANGSGASLSNARSALLNLFHYKNVSYNTPGGNITNWINSLKSEIDAERPIIYAGYESTGEGHAFVLYGYDNNNKFIINWGWGGSYNNGYYALDSLVPNPQSSFNYNQEALWGIEPKYPNCSSHNLLYTDIYPTPFDYYNGGIITIKNKTIGNNKIGVIYSGESVSIQSACTISAGSNVRIAVRDMHCGSSGRGEEDVLQIIADQENITSIEHFSNISSFSVSPNPAQDFITISCVNPIVKVTIFDFGGRMVLRGTETQINVSSFPAGVYVVHVQTDDGNQYQAKFIKQ